MVVCALEDWRYLQWRSTQLDIWCHIMVPPCHKIALPRNTNPQSALFAQWLYKSALRKGLALFQGEYCSRKYKMCRMYTDVQCFVQCWYNCETLRPQGLICIGLRSPSVVIEAISLNNDRISQYYNNSTTHPELQCFLRFLALRHTMRITHCSIEALSIVEAISFIVCTALVSVGGFANPTMMHCNKT